MTGCAVIQIGGETLWLHPERAILWPKGGAVIVADTHFGKSSVFGRHGLAVPAGSDDKDRERLTRLVCDSEAQRLIILGDFVHEPLRIGSREAADLERWSASLRSIRIQVIAGNHDRGISHGWRGSLEWIAGELIEPPFRFIHDLTKARAQVQDLFSLSGHIHPVIALKGMRKSISRIPVFWQREESLVLPSFGLFTGGYLIKPESGERVFAVGPEQVVPFPPRQIGSASRRVSEKK